MPGRRRIAPALALLLVLVAAAAAPPAAARSQPAGPPPRLIVVISVDGLSWSRLAAWRRWYTSGLKRLLEEGAVATACRYPHLDTETAPGHASLSTGAPPRVHGIALNQWYALSADGTKMQTIYSASLPPFDAPAGAKPVLGAGRLKVPTLADHLVASDPRARVVSISIKDRAAILLAGRDPRHMVYWYASDRGTFVSSPSYDATTPIGSAAARIVAHFNETRAGENLAQAYGAIVDRLPVPSPAPTPGFEGGLDDYQDAVAGRGFPKDLTKGKKPLPAAVLWTSVSDRLLTDLALEFLADDTVALGRDDIPDLLEISFSANDYVAHYYGPESVENLEILRGLDSDLGRFLGTLEEKLGRDHVAVVLSADHGMLPLPEATQRREHAPAPRRVRDVTIAKQLNEAVDRALGLDPGAAPVYRLEGCGLWLDRTVVDRPGGPASSRVLEVVRRELATTWKDAVERTIPVDPSQRPAPSDRLALLAWNAMVPVASGDLIVVPREGFLIDPYEGKGTSHGTPWEYDTHVPLIFWGGGIRARRIKSDTSPYDVAPTVGSWIGVTLPDAAGTRMDVRAAGATGRR